MPLYTCTKVNASLQFLKPSWDKKSPFDQTFLPDQRPDQYKTKIEVFSIQYDFSIPKYLYQYLIWRILNKYMYLKMWREILKRVVPITLGL